MRTNWHSRTNLHSYLRLLLHLTGWINALPLESSLNRWLPAIEQLTSHGVCVQSPEGSTLATI